MAGLCLAKGIHSRACGRQCPWYTEPWDETPAISRKTVLACYPRAAFDWLIDNGCPEPGDGNQAKLEERVTNWLEDHGHEASEAAVRRHVVRWIKDRRAELNG